MKKTLLSSGVCLLTAIIWGFAFSAQEMATRYADELDVFYFMTFRFLVGAISLLPVILLFEREKIADNPKKFKTTVLSGVITGVVLFIASVSQQYAIQVTGQSGKIGFLTGLYLIFVPIATSILFKKRVSPFVWLAVFFAVVGLYFLGIGASGFSVQWGDVIAFLSAFVWTAHILVVDRYAKNVSLLKYSCVQFFTVALLSLIFALCFGTFTTQGLTHTLFPIAYCGILSTGGAYTLQAIGQKNTPPAVASILFATESLFSVVAECLVEGSLPSSTMVIGCSLLFVGIMVSQLPAFFPKKAEK